MDFPAFSFRIGKVIYVAFLYVSAKYDPFAVLILLLVAEEYVDLAVGRKVFRKNRYSEVRVGRNRGEVVDCRWNIK